MAAYTIRYRFNGPGPAALLVEFEDALRMYCRGRLSAPLTERNVAVLLGGRGARWVAVTGELTVEDGMRSLEHGEPIALVEATSPSAASA